jgi:hypothetical protein
MPCSRFARWIARNAIALQGCPCVFKQSNLPPRNAAPVRVYHTKLGDLGDLDWGDRLEKAIPNRRGCPEMSLSALADFAILRSAAPSQVCRRGTSHKNWRSWNRLEADAYLLGTLAYFGNVGARERNASGKADGQYCALRMPASNGDHGPTGRAENGRAMVGHHICISFRVSARPPIGETPCEHHR